jgi:DNA-binding PadR family transcriptional regulator
MLLQHMAMPLPEQKPKKGSAELLILPLLEDWPRHGYDIRQLIQLRYRAHEPRYA